MSFQKMTPEQWIKVLPNPRQRPTEAHAAKAIKKHLKNYSVTQDAVFAAALPGGKLFKLDGHTRALLWEQGLLAKPPCVYVRVYLAKNMDEVKELYSHFDTTSQTETTMDMTGGAFNENSLTITSGLIKYKANTSAFRKLVIGEKPIYQIISAWKREIEALDQIGFAKNSIRSGGVLGALVLLRFYPLESVVAYLTQIQQDAGIKDQRGLDAVQMFRKLNEAKLDGHPERQVWDLAGRMAALYQGFLAGKRYIKSPPALDIKEMIASNKRGV